MSRPVTSTTTLDHLDDGRATVTVHGEAVVVTFGDAFASARLVGTPGVVRRLVSDALVQIDAASGGA